MLEIFDMPGHLVRRMNQMAVSLFMEETSKAGFNLTPVQYAALSAIKATPALDQATLANNIAYDRVTIGGVIDRLEKKELVRREISIEDRRARKLYLTPQGETILADASPVVRRMQTKLMEELDPSEQKVFLSLLRKVTKTSKR